MYWIYLSLFVLAILTPQYISREVGFLREEDIEALLIFCFGAFGFMIYLAKEKTLLKVFREKLHLEKQANLITRDLSDSYSYIGEMNRKLDIVQDFIYDLPKATATALSKDEGSVYTSLLETVSLLGKTDEVALCFVHTRNKSIEHCYEKGGRTAFSQSLTASELLGEGKYFWQTDRRVIVRSPRQAKSITAFLVFGKTMNRVEDSDVFKILVSQALLLYTLEERMSRS